MKAGSAMDVGVRMDSGSAPLNSYLSLTQRLVVVHIRGHEEVTPHTGTVIQSLDQVH